MNILIRSDSSSFIGTGHIMRDLVLAKQYANQNNILFATLELEGNINYKIEEAGYQRILLKSNDFEELDFFIKNFDIDMIIIDHYGIDYNFEKRLKESNNKLKIMVLDDTYKSHYCDILLNHNIYAEEKKYENKLPIDCELRCGKGYTLLRDEFIDIKQKKFNITKGRTKTIFVAMGGSDHSNINLKILDVLSEFRNIKVYVVTTNANKNLNKLKKYCKNKKWISLHINSNKIAELMMQSSFAIVTPSVTLNEIVYLNIPFIAIKTAENQKYMYRFLRNNRLLVIDNFKKISFANLLKRMFYGKYQIN